MVMFSFVHTELLMHHSLDIISPLQNISASLESVSFMHNPLNDDQSFECLQFIKFNTLREDKTISLWFWLLNIIAIKSTQSRSFT